MNRRRRVRVPVSLWPAIPPPRPCLDPPRRAPRTQRTSAAASTRGRGGGPARTSSAVPVSSVFSESLRVSSRRIEIDIYKSEAASDEHAGRPAGAWHRAAAARG